MSLGKDLGKLDKVRFEKALKEFTCPHCKNSDSNSEAIAHYQTQENLQDEEKSNNHVFTVDYKCDCGQNYSTTEIL